MPLIINITSILSNFGGLFGLVVTHAGQPFFVAAPFTPVLTFTLRGIFVYYKDYNLLNPMGYYNIMSFLKKKSISWFSSLRLGYFNSPFLTQRFIFLVLIYCRDISKPRYQARLLSPKSLCCRCHKGQTLNGTGNAWMPGPNFPFLPHLPTFLSTYFFFFSLGRQTGISWILENFNLLAFD